MSLSIGSSPRCFVGVVSLEHATRGYDMGFTQACHGKRAPLSRMNKGDLFVQYSPKLALRGKKPYQKFSYIGTVSTGTVYQVEMAPGFKPFRIDIDYLRSDQAQHTSIRPLIDRLSFITNKTKWGAKFRFGFLEIPIKDFGIIYKAMTGETFKPIIKTFSDTVEMKSKTSKSVHKRSVEKPSIDPQFKAGESSRKKRKKDSQPESVQSFSIELQKV